MLQEEGDGRNGGAGGHDSTGKPGACPQLETILF